jgi:hypothetical protein
VEILSLILGITVLIILVFILSVVSRVNILVKQVEQVIDIIEKADSRIDDLAKDSNLQKSE